jgi:c-di-GMP-binding flagellar brake protein YcgR
MAEQASLVRAPQGSATRTMQQRRRHPRVSVTGQVRLVADTGNGIVTLSGNVVDLSVGGCAIRVYASLEANKEARLELQVGGERVWVPGRIMWTRARERSWIVGVQFDGLVPEKQSLLVRLVAERRRNSG